MPPSQRRGEEPPHDPTPTAQSGGVYAGKRHRAWASSLFCAKPAGAGSPEALRPVAPSSEPC